MIDDIPPELAQAVARDRCVVFLGQGERRRDLTARLAAAAGLADGDTPLLRIANVYAANPATLGRQRLVAHLRDWLEANHPRPTPLQTAVAQLPVRRLVDCGYDNQLKAALEKGGRPVSLIVRDTGLSLADRRRVLLIKPYGTADQPADLRLTEEDFYRLNSAAIPESRLLGDQLRLWVSSCVWLWLDVDPTDSDWKDLHTTMTDGIQTRHRPAYAATPTAAQHAAWRALGVTPLTVPDIPAWLAALQSTAQALPPEEPVAASLPPERRPYKFLDYYTAADADLFFGRERWIESLAGRIQAQPLVVLWGASGVGKTSLLRAGVLPRLAARGYWPIYARPNDDPAAAIRAAALADLTPEDQAALAGLSDLGDFLAKAGARRGLTPVIALDQAEECFTTLPAAATQRWVATLAGALGQQRAELRWVLALRQDFAAELHAWSERIPFLFEQTVLLTALTREEARAAIAQPPRQVGVVIENALVERLLDDLTGDGVEPAQLQIVCERLYQVHDERAGMTLARYTELGGHTRILADYVEFALARLPYDQRELAVALLKAMVTPQGTKRPLRREELLGAVTGEMSARRETLAGLVDARLVRSLALGDEHERRYELAHDVLALKVNSWIDEIERAAGQAREVLRQEHSARRQVATVLPEREKLLYFYAQRDNPYWRLDAADLGLLLRGALAENVEPAYWVGRAAAAGYDIWPELQPALAARDEGLRRRALAALTGAGGDERALAVLQAAMVDESPRVRVTTHQALLASGAPRALALLDGSDDLRLVPAGEFTLGDGRSIDCPAHKVYLDAFFAEKYPVTYARYAAFMAAGGYDDPHYWTSAGWRWRLRSRRQRPSNWRDDRPDYPVVWLFWHEAWAYAAWAGRRLLSEAEWEKAARGPDGRIYPWGDTFDAGKCNTSEGKRGGTTPVGAYSPQGDSSYGCADMSGNVWEFTSTLYRPYPYMADDGREDPEGAGWRVSRGGSYYEGASSARGASRGSAVGRGFGNDGFRCGVGSGLFSPPPAGG